MITVRGMIKGGVHARYPDVFIEGLKNGVLDGTLKAVGVVTCFAIRILTLFPAC